MTSGARTARRLVIMRHAKAEQSEDAAGHPTRVVARVAATTPKPAGRWFASHDLVPNVVLCSPAVRTRGTWHGVAIGGSPTPEPRSRRPYGTRTPHLPEA